MGPSPSKADPLPGQQGYEPNKGVDLLTCQLSPTQIQGRSLWWYTLGGQQGMGNPPAPSDVYPGVPAPENLPPGQVYNWPGLLHSPLIVTWASQMFQDHFFSAWLFGYSGPTDNAFYQAASFAWNWILSNSTCNTTPLHYDPANAFTSGFTAGSVDPLNPSIAVQGAPQGSWQQYKGGRPLPPTLYFMNAVFPSGSTGAQNPWLFLSWPPAVQWINNYWGDYVDWLTNGAVQVPKVPGITNGNLPTGGPPSLAWYALPVGAIVLKKLVL